MRPILYLLPFCLVAIAAPTPANSGDENDDRKSEEWDGDMIENKDGPTADGSPGIGIEFETGMFYFSSPSCPEATVNNAKKKVLAGRKQKVDSGKSPLWMLTADTGAGERILQAEYIIDGQQIKLGSGQAEKVTKEIIEDITDWQPWKKRTRKDRVKIEVEDTPCDFYIDGPHPTLDVSNVFWQPQITAPLPLEALYVLMKVRATYSLVPESNEYFDIIGDGPKSLFETQVLVNKNYFKKKPNGIDGALLTDDTLAFLSLVLTYAKAIAKNPLKRDESVKLRSVFMPRTDFYTLYTKVKSQLPGDLWNIINTISCYTPMNPREKNPKKVDLDRLYLDSQLCRIENHNGKRTVVPGTTLGNARFGSTTIEDWIRHLDREDLLTTFDKTIDGSIGGLGSKMEKVLGTSREVPLFEFRDLNWLATLDMAHFARDAAAKLKALHQKFKQAPTKGK